MKAKLGRMSLVQNKGRKWGAAPVYVALPAENQDGSRQETLLFTRHQIAVARRRAKRNPEDCTRKGFFTALFD